jgi:hypothetical protein
MAKIGGSGSSLVSAGSQIGSTLSSAANAGVSDASMAGSTASAIAQMQGAMQAENAINAAQALFQVEEAGPKGAKSLTQG